MLMEASPAQLKSKNKEVLTPKKAAAGSDHAEVVKELAKAYCEMCGSTREEVLAREDGSKVRL